MANLNISFDFSYYNKTETDQIVRFDNTELAGNRMILSAVAGGLTPGTQYNLNFELTNSNDEIFEPLQQTIYASSNTQKFSTIAFFIPKRAYIIKATITPANNDTGASDIVTILYNLENLEDTDDGVRNTGEYVEIENKPILIINDQAECESQVAINAHINNAVKGKTYTYNFSACEHDQSNGIDFNPKSGTVIAGNRIQNISTIAKFTGSTNVFCLKLDITTSDNALSDYLLIQCKACSND